MPLTKKEYDRLRYIEKRDEKLQQVKDYYQKNSEKIQAYQKVYNVDNAEKIKKRQSDYQKKEYLKDPEKIRLRNEKWKTENPEKAQEVTHIANWKQYGIICDEWEVIYRIYMDTTNCDFCQEPFKNSKDRCLDHDHSITDSFNIRGILCRQCNFKDKLKGYDIMELDCDL